jgi:hypothetical protein
VVVLPEIAPIRWTGPAERRLVDREVIR